MLCPFPSLQHPSAKVPISLSPKISRVYLPQIHGLFIICTLAVLDSYYFGQQGQTFSLCYIFCLAHPSPRNKNIKQDSDCVGYIFLRSIASTPSVRAKPRTASSAVPLQPRFRLLLPHNLVRIFVVRNLSFIDVLCFF